MASAVGLAVSNRLSISRSAIINQQPDMAHSGKQRPRDLQPGHRELRDEEVSSKYRVFRLSHDEREEIAAALRRIDDARETIERQQNPANRHVLRELNAAADHIYDILNELEHTDE